MEKKINPCFFGFRGEDSPICRRCPESGKLCSPAASDQGHTPVTDWELESWLHQLKPTKSPGTNQTSISRNKTWILVCLGTTLTGGWIYGNDFSCRERQNPIKAHHSSHVKGSLARGPHQRPRNPLLRSLTSQAGLSAEPAVLPWSQALHLPNLPPGGGRVREVGDKAGMLVRVYKGSIMQNDSVLES